MSVRQVRDARDTETKELIYFKGHAQSTYMSDGSTVEDNIKIFQHTILEKIYPVNSIYISVSNINPFEIFGFGEWEPIKDRFLLAAGDKYIGGMTGGEYEHTLSINELPEHYHTTHGIGIGTTASEKKILRYVRLICQNNIQEMLLWPPIVLVQDWHIIICPLI